MYTYPRPSPRSYSSPVLSNEGALLEALLKWGRARAGRRGNLKADAAPAAMPRKRGPGGPWVTVRAHYGALPSMAGRDRRRVGESLPGWRACSRLRPEVRPQGQKSLRWSVRKALLLPRRVVRRSISPQGRGDQLKAQLARRRENAKSWLFERESRNFAGRCNNLCIIRGLAVFAKASPA